MHFCNLQPKAFKISKKNFFDPGQPYSLFIRYGTNSKLFVISPNYKEFEAEILDLQSEKYGLSFDLKNIYILLPVDPWGMRM